MLEVLLLSYVFLHIRKTKGFQILIVYVAELLYFLANEHSSSDNVRLEHMTGLNNYHF